MGYRAARVGSELDAASTGGSLTREDECEGDKVSSGPVSILTRGEKLIGLDGSESDGDEEFGVVFCVPVSGPTFGSGDGR